MARWIEFLLSPHKVEDVLRKSINTLIFIAFMSSSGSVFGADEAVEEKPGPGPGAAPGAKVIYVMTDEQRLYAWEQGIHQQDLRQ
jgi:hypothetical protein